LCSQADTVPSDFAHLVLKCRYQ